MHITADSKPYFLKKRTQEVMFNRWKHPLKTGEITKARPHPSLQRLTLIMILKRFHFLLEIFHAAPTVHVSASSLRPTALPATTVYSAAEQPQQNRPQFPESTSSCRLLGRLRLFPPSFLHLSVFLALVLHLQGRRMHSLHGRVLNLTTFIADRKWDGVMMNAVDAVHFTLMSTRVTVFPRC